VVFSFLSKQKYFFYNDMHTYVFWVPACGTKIIGGPVGGGGGGGWLKASTIIFPLTIFRHAMVPN